MRQGDRGGVAAALLVVLLLGAAAVPAAAANDTAALLGLKAAVAGTSADSLANWTAAGNPCSTTDPWEGVTCTAGRVTAVTLSGYALSGTLPASLDLGELQELDLSANALDGTLPPTLALPSLQRLDLGGNVLTGPLPPSWAANFPRLTNLTLRGNDLTATLPPAWLGVGAPGFARPFEAVLRPGNELLCGAVPAGSPNHTLLWDDGTDGAGASHEIATTLGSCAQQTSNCGAAAVNRSAPNLYDLAWANRVAVLDLEAFNPSVQQTGAPKLGTPVTLPCYPSNAPTFFGADAAYGKAAWQSSTEGERGAALPVTGQRPALAAATAAQCSATADAPAFWMVDLQHSTKVLAVLVRAGPANQMQGVEIRVSETTDPYSGSTCKANVTFTPSQGKIIVCDRLAQGRYLSITAQSKVSLCVVEVYPLASNAALGKPTTASTGGTDAQTAQVVNGNMANTACATVVSGSDLAAWITIDLGYDAPVETVVVQNGFSIFRADLEVRLGNTPVVNGDENEVCSQAQTLDARVTLPIQCVRADGQPASGRFLTLYRKRDQASDMYICQVLVYLAAGPTKFFMSPPAPPLPPAVPSPSPSPPAPAGPQQISVDASTTAMAVSFELWGPSLLPLGSDTQENIVLAARSVWLEAPGVTAVDPILFSVSGDITTQSQRRALAQTVGGGNGTAGAVAAQLRVAVNAGFARSAAQYIWGTSDDGSLQTVLDDQGAQLDGVITTMTSIRDAGGGNSPAPGPSPPPDGSPSGGGVSVGAIVGGVVGGLAVVLAALALLVARRRRRAAAPALHDDGSHSPKVGAMEQGVHSSPLAFLKPGEGLNGYSVAALASAPGGSGNFAAHLKLTGEPMTEGPPPEIISFLSDDARSDHSAMATHGNGAAGGAPLTRDSPPGWGGSSTAGGSEAGGAALPLAKQKSRVDSGVSELWTVNFGELGIQKQIGEGSFGKVYLAKWRETTVAVKVLGSVGSSNSTGLDDEFPDASAAAKAHPLYESLQKEAAMMASLRHPSIVMYLGVCLDPPAVVTEYCARGSLNDVLKRARSSPLLAAQLDWARRLNMALDAAKGMLYLHSCSPPIIHRDLKSANLLVDKHWRVRVCDFNLSRVMEDQAVLSSVAATNPRWLAPEILSGKGYTFASDVYSFGICMWEMLTWQVPYWEYGPWQVVAMVTESAKRPEVPPPDELPTAGFGGEAEYLALMTECWAQDPEARPTFAAVISRLRRMLAEETNARRDTSPTKALRANASTLSVGSGMAGGDDTPLTRSRLTTGSLTAGSELAVGSPDPGSSRGGGSDIDHLSISPSRSLTAGPRIPTPRRRSPDVGPSRSALVSINSGGTDEAEVEAAQADAARLAAAVAAAPPG